MYQGRTALHTHIETLRLGEFPVIILVRNFFAQNFTTHFSSQYINLSEFSRLMYIL